MGNFWEAQGNVMALPAYASEIPECGTSGKPKATMLPEHASEMPGWETFGKLEAMILPEHASQMPGWEFVGKLKAIASPEHASKMAGWETFLKYGVGKAFMRSYSVDVAAEYLKQSP